MNYLGDTFIKIIFGLIAVFLIGAMFVIPQLNYGGDIVEYHGITESLIKDFRIHLTKETADNLVNYLQPAYLEDPGYYIEGRNGERYPVHFILYSILATPVRIILKVLSLNELHTLRITNVLILLGTSFYILKHFLTSAFQKLAFLGFVFLSPLMWFLIWPGPDVFYLSMLMLGVFFFIQKKYLTSLLFTILASWHSQPLLITAFGIGLYDLYRSAEIHTKKDGKYITILSKKLFIFAGLGIMALVPYMYNLYAFGTLTPWTILKDGWTVLNGFGIHNARPGKLFEQLFDLNFGIFWYAPVLFILGVVSAIKASLVRKDILFLTLLFFPVTALFYQTNPAWHYGTSGFGPSRHAIFLLPLLIAYATYGIMQIPFKKIVFGIYIAVALFIASLNGFLYPNLMNTLYHSPLATYVLKNAPQLYSPTPEIFVDRTNHTDLTYPSTAIYKDGDTCKKAYVLVTDKDLLEAQCGKIPEEYEDRFDNPFARKTNVKRTTFTTEATFWPDPGSCGDNFFPTEERPYVCMETIDHVTWETGVYDAERFEQVDDLPGVWRLKAGDPVEITIPQGYLIHHKSFDGFYVNY